MSLRDEYRPLGELVDRLQKLGPRQCQVHYGQFCWGTLPGHEACVLLTTKQVLAKEADGD